MNPTRLMLYALTCGAMALAPELAGAAEMRGFASVSGMGVILFQPCQGKAISPRALTIEDETRDSSLTEGLLAVRKIMLNSGRPIYVEFRGDAAGSTVKARRFLRASGTVPSCADASAEIPAAARLWAIGGDPNWRLAADASGARLERPGMSAVRFPSAAFAPPASGKNASRVIDAWSAQDGGTIHVEIAEQTCSDGRSETAYGATASVRYGSRTYEGCAARF